MLLFCYPVEMNSHHMRDSGVFTFYMAFLIVTHLRKNVNCVRNHAYAYSFRGCTIRVRWGGMGYWINN